MSLIQSLRARGVQSLSRIGFSFIFLVASLSLPLQAQVGKLGATLTRAMDNIEGPYPVIVTMEPVPLPQRSFWNNLTPAELEYYLQTKTAEAQWNLRELVNEVASYGNANDISNFMPFWSTNSMMMTASVDVIMQISQLPEVTSIIYDRPVWLTYRRDEEEAVAEYTYGLEKIGIPQLRYDYPELTGTGVVVGILDTGIDAQHPELQGKVVAWKDFILGKKEPYDDNGHGTHVAGTIAGSGVIGTQFGVAPNVKLVVGKILGGNGGGTLGGIIRAMDWIANPERKLSSAIRPRVVNNSWGGSRSSDVRRDPFAQAVVNWMQLEIFPSFAAGNSGPSRDTIGSPGALPAAFAVGATDSYDEVTSFSSRGPVKIRDFDGEVKTLTKPEIAAPGAKIFSTLPGGKYGRLSGTSMATPHVTGAIALIYQYNPNLRVVDVQELLVRSALDLGVEGPDNSYGAGRMDVFRAIQMHP